MEFASLLLGPLFGAFLLLLLLLARLLLPLRPWVLLRRSARGNTRGPLRLTPNWDLAKRGEVVGELVGGARDVGEMVGGAGGVGELVGEAQGGHVPIARGACGECEFARVTHVQEGAAVAVLATLGGAEKLTSLPVPVSVIIAIVAAGVGVRERTVVSVLALLGGAVKLTSLASPWRRRWAGAVAVAVAIGVGRLATRGRG